MKGWLDKYKDGGEVNLNDDIVKLPPNYNGMGYSSPQWKSPAWGGQFQNGGEMKYYQNGEDFQPKTISEDGGDYSVNGQPFNYNKGLKLDSLSNRLRDLQFEQTQKLQKAYPTLPLESILTNADTDKNFRNRNLDAKADSLISLYGDVNIPASEDFIKTNRQYQDLINDVDQPLPLIGTQEQTGLKNFGYRSMLQKYLHPQNVPAYKMLEYENGGNVANVQMKNQLMNLDQLTNFSNNNKKSDWLTKYI